MSLDTPTGPAPQPWRDDLAWARVADSAEALAPLRDEFLFPPAADGTPMLYFAGHSLGLQPRATRAYVEEALDDWARYGVEGHFAAQHPWLPYHELLTAPTARLVGARPDEVVVMNTLTVNVHLMLVSFYRPTVQRHGILVEGGAFPSDQYAVASQARFPGYDPAEAIHTLQPRPGEATLRPDDVLERIERDGERLALILLGNVNYLTGQAFDIPAIVRAGHAKGCVVGFDLAHGAGNLLLQLHDWDVDFAVWCNYKYLNAGPGGLGGVFVHERHGRDPDLPRFAGWWGHDKRTRFQMGDRFQPIAGAEGWQLSNPPILQLAALRAAMALFDRAGMAALRARSERLTGYLEWLLDRLPPGLVEVLTPRDPARRGAMLTLRVAGDAAGLVRYLHEHGALCDLRPPDIVRVAPAPLYCGFADVQRLVALLRAWHDGRAAYA